MDIESDHLEALVTNLLRDGWFTIISFVEPGMSEKTSCILVHGAHKSEADDIKSLVKYLRGINIPMDQQLDCIQSMGVSRFSIRDLI